MATFLGRHAIALALLGVAASVPATVRAEPPIYLTQWGSQGSGNGQFSYPSAIAADAAGRLYVADRNNHRIQVFSGAGTYLTQWGSQGGGPGQFYGPAGIAVSSAGDVYVADTQNHRIQRFSSTGAYVTRWGSFGAGNGEFQYPFGVATDAAGNVYVADSHNHRIQKFTATGTYITQWGSFGTGNGQFRFLGDLAVDAAGDLYVVEYGYGNDRVQKFTGTGTYLTQWGAYGSGDGQVYTPMGVATDADGNVFIADYDNHRIQKFTDTGAYLTQWGSFGSGDGQFNYPIGVTTGAGGSVYVVEYGNHRVQKFAPAPAFGEWPPSGLPLATGPTQQTSPVGLTGPGGELQAFWVDAGSATHALYSQHLTLQGTLAPGWPAGGRGVVAVPAAISTPKVAPDGFGGAVVAWYDYRTSVGSRGIYAIRVNAEAALEPGWNASGTPICVTTDPVGTGPMNDLIAVCTDGAGGAFVAWTDARNTPVASTLVYDVFAHHVLFDGSLDPTWPAPGRGLTTGPGYKYPHALIADGSGGFWLATENSNATYEVAATHHGADGDETGRWSSVSFASRVAGVSDGAGGVFLTWRDCRDCASGSDAIYAIRLGPSAAPRPGWPVDGVAISASPGDDDLPVIVATGEGSAMIAWLETGDAPDAYVARRVEADGTFALPWQSGGRMFAESTDILSGWPLIAPDGDGGAMFAFRRNTPNLFGSRVDAAAQVPAGFPNTGLSLCSLSGDQFPVSLVSDGLNGAFLLWQDTRDFAASHFDVYATRFTREGQAGSTTGVIQPPIVAGLAMSAPRPNPASALSSFDLTMPATAHARVEVFDLAGRLLVVLHEGNLAVGTHVMRWDGRDQDRRQVPAGIYLARTRTANSTLGQRIVRLP